jgi:rhodanese-related sulfurtransferase
MERKNMKTRKIYIGMLVCLMLLIPTLQVVGTTNQITQDKGSQQKDIVNFTPLLNDNLSVEIYSAPGFIGVNIDVTNTGSTSIENVKWSFRSKAAITGTGLLINEKIRKGVIEEIQVDETITLTFRPFNKDTPSPIGFGNLYMNVSIHHENYSIRIQQRSMLLLFFLLGFKETYMDIKPPEAYAMYLNGTFDLIIDVVGLDIYSLGHLPSAVNYVWADGTLNEKIPELDPLLTYLVYCHTDPPSTAGAQALVDAGFENVYRLEGNFAAWKNGGYPVET